MCLGLPTTFAQNTSTQGKEFWLSFMHNGFRDHSLGGGWITNQVLISAKRDCSGTVTNPLTGWEQSFTVRANSITTVDIPEAQGYHNGSNNETISNKAIKVVANDTISVYCTNIAYVSFDASFVLPIESLGDEYIIQSYDQSRNGGDDTYEHETSAFLIVATEDNTEIEITPTINTLGGHTAEQAFTITLNAGETYQVRSPYTGSNRDLSGTHVWANDCKKIAVFNGNNLTTVPYTITNGFDQVFEQAMPLRSWGKSFVVTSSLNRNRDFIKITSSANDNQITKNGELLTTLNAGESYTFDMLESVHSCFIQTTQPSAVYLYNNSSRDQNPLGGLGDPSMVWIAPVEQRIDDVTFTTFNNSSINITVHSVNIIVRTDDTDKVYFDDELLSPLSFSSVAGNRDYSFIRQNISHGVHHISCINGFNAHVYGFGDAKGYAYLVGSNAIDLSTNLNINDVQVQANETFPYCVEQPVTFSAEVNYQEYDLLWDFGDGTTSTQNPVTHTYHDKRIYEASLYVDTDASGCASANSDTLNFYIDLTQQYVTESDEICAGELYSGYGFNNVLINNDTILGRLQDNPVNPECKDSLLVYITARPNYHVPITDSRCWQGTPSVFDDYGFSFEYEGPGTYERVQEWQTAQGCDSIVTLTLTVADQVTYDFDHHECSGSYNWDGRTYDQEGVYPWTYTTAGGCDSIATLHLTMGQNQHYEFDTTLCGPFTWDGTVYEDSGVFTRYYNTYDGCDSVVVCHLSVSGNIEGATTYATGCDSYEWLDSTYIESGVHSHSYPTPLGCDSTIYLDLALDYSPNPTDIYPVDPENIFPHWVVTATEFQINSYDFTFRDHNSACQWDSVSWRFENPEVRWLLEPDNTTTPIGKTCKMYVLNYVADTIWLRATAYNHCNPQGATQRYWFICSFYGTNDQVVQPEIEIMPNPNKGTMSICFGEMDGLVHATVYDMQGQTIDQFNFAATPKSRLSYNLSSQKSGIYLFVFNYNGSVITKKIIIIN